MEDTIHVEMELEQKMCNICKKTDSDYYELKLQIRFLYFLESEIEIIQEDILEILSKNLDNINKIEYVNTGIDLFLNSIGDRNKVSSLLRKKYFFESKISKKIVGKDFLRSCDIWRYTQLVKIINLKIGDVVELKGEQYTIKGFNNSDIILVSMKNKSKKIFSYQIIKDYLHKNFN